MIEAKLYKKLNKKQVKCGLCNQRCLILPERTGLCDVRLNKKGRLCSLVYGRPISVQVDPIEKKPLYHFMTGTATLSFGTFGCNFRCGWCQNWEISQGNKKNSVIPAKATYNFAKCYVAKAGIHSIDSVSRHGMTIINELSLKVSPREIVEMAKKENCPSISYTYTEPTIFFEYAFDTMKLAHKAGLKNIWVSNGYFTEECFKEIEPYLDAVNVDLKSFDDKVYQKYCGARLQPVLDNLERIYHSRGAATGHLRGGLKRTSEVGEEQGHKIHLEITTLVIPDVNDDDDQLKKIAQFIAKLDPSTPWHLSRFFPCYKMTDIEPTPISTLKKAQKIAKKAGLKHVYLGNI